MQKIASVSASSKALCSPKCQSFSRSLWQHPLNRPCCNENTDTEEIPSENPCWKLLQPKRINPESETLQHVAILALALWLLSLVTRQMASSGSQAKKAWSFIRDQPRGASFAVVRRHSFRHEPPCPCPGPPSRVHLFVPFKTGNHIGRAPGIVHSHATDDVRGLEHGRPSMVFEDTIFNRYASHKLKEKEATRDKGGPSRPRRPITADTGTASSGPDSVPGAPADAGCDPASTMPKESPVDVNGGPDS